MRIALKQNRVRRNLAILSDAAVKAMNLTNAIVFQLDNDLQSGALMS
jgi:hypothetical protein